MGRRLVSLGGRVLRQHVSEQFLGPLLPYCVGVLYRWGEPGVHQRGGALYRYYTDDFGRGSFGTELSLPSTAGPVNSISCPTERLCLFTTVWGDVERGAA